MLHNSSLQSLNQVIDIIEGIQKLPKEKLENPYFALNIGNHVRHIFDHYLALKTGVEQGVVNYNNRSRGSKIESDSNVGLAKLKLLIEWIEVVKKNHSPKKLEGKIKVLSEIDCLQTQSMEFDSNIARELLYLINHTIHHAAHIGLILKHHGIEVPLNAGMAPCTMSFLRDGTK